MVLRRRSQPDSTNQVLFATRFQTKSDGAPPREELSTKVRPEGPQFREGESPLGGHPAKGAPVRVVTAVGLRPELPFVRAGSGSRLRSSFWALNPRRERPIELVGDFHVQGEELVVETGLGPRS